MPFGTNDSGGALARALDFVFGYLKFLLRFVDENLCISDTFENHLLHLKIIFRKCEEFNIKLHFSKCHFCMERITFLGYVLTPGGLEIDPENKESQRITTPKKFEGIARFFRTPKFLLKIHSLIIRSNITIITFNHKKHQVYLDRSTSTGVRQL